MAAGAISGAALSSPPGDILAVTGIRLGEDFLITESSSVFPKEVSGFYVEATVENFSSVLVRPNLELKFYDQITNREVVLNQATGTRDLPVGPKSEASIVFDGIGSGVFLETEDMLVAGENYWVEVSVTNPGAEQVVVNNELRVPLSVVASKDFHVPELSLLSVLAVAFGVLFIASKGESS